MIGRQQGDFRPAHLPLYAAAVYGLLVIYASLHPFLGWKDGGVPLAAFLQAGWPRYWTVFDIVANVLAYLPLGFLLVPALQSWFGRVAACGLAILLGCVLSLTLETLQNYLPSRVASNVDLATNCLGLLAGAIVGARWGASLLDGGRLHRWSVRLVGDGALPHAGLILIGLWLLTQLNPGTLLFGNGDLRGLLAAFDVPHALPYVAEDFPWIEAGVAAGNTLSIGLICSCLLCEWQRLGPFVLVTSAVAVKSVALVLQLGGDGLIWITRGNMAGLVVGATLWLAASFFSYQWRQVLAAISLMLAAVLVNLASENPYHSAMLQTWQHGHFLNFNGLTRLTAVVWPFLAMTWLMMLRASRGTVP